MIDRSRSTNKSSHLIDRRSTHPPLLYSDRPMSEHTDSHRQQPWRCSYLGETDVMISLSRLGVCGTNIAPWKIRSTAPMNTEQPWKHNLDTAFRSTPSPFFALLRSATSALRWRLFILEKRDVISSLCPVKK